jgi:hypothetical protein
MKKKKKPTPANKDNSFYVSCATDKLFSQKAHMRPRLHIGATLVSSRSRRRRSPCLPTKVDHFMCLVQLTNSSVKKTRLRLHTGAALVNSR